MKTLTALILVCISATASAQFSPTQDRKGFIGGYFRGANLDVTNTTFYTASGVAFAAIDQYAGVTLSDTNGVTKFLFDGFDSTLSLMDKLGTVRLDVDAANKLHINNPIITGTLTGSILNATNLPVSGLNTNGGTPGQVATAQANGTVTWSNAPAGSGSAVTFNPNQFGSSSIGTNLLDGVLITNPVVKITTDTDHTLIQTTTGGTPFLSYNVSPDTLVFNRPPIADGSALTNLNASQLTSGTVNTPVTNSAVKTGNILVTNNATISGDLSVSGTQNVGTMNVTNLYSTASGNTNRVTIFGPNGNFTNVSLVNLTLDTGVFPATLTASAGGGGGDMTNNSTIGWTNKANIVITNAGVANTKLYLDGSRTTSGNVFQYMSNNVSKTSIDTDGTITTAGGVITTSFMRADGSFGINFTSRGTIYASSADEINFRRSATANNYANITISNAVSSGFKLATNGIASFSSTASVAIDSTGWTNIWSTNNAVIVFGGSTVSSWKKRAGALTSTNITYPVFASGNQTVILQPGQAIVISGTDVTGSADPL